MSSYARPQLATTSAENSSGVRMLSTNRGADDQREANDHGAHQDGERGILLFIDFPPQMVGCDSIEHDETDGIDDDADRAEHDGIDDRTPIECVHRCSLFMEVV